MTDAAPSGGTPQRASPAPAEQTIEQSTGSTGQSPTAGAAPTSRGMPGEIEPGSGAQDKSALKPGRPARPSLPGVIMRGDEDGLFPDLTGRDEKGRFVSRTAERKAEEGDLTALEPGARVPALKPDLPAESPEQKAAREAAAPVAPTTKITFAGKEQTIAEAEQRHKTLEGMHRKLTDERDYGYKAAHQWIEVAQTQARRISELEAQLGSGQGKPAPGAAASAPASASAPGAEPSEDDLVAGIDMQVFEEIAAHPNGGLRVAGQYLARELLGAVRSKILPAVRAEIAAVRAPQEQAQQFEQQQAGFTQTLEHLGSLQLPGGGAAYPEVSDVAALEQIGTLWKDEGHDIAQLFTPRGMSAAIALYRMSRSFHPAPSAPTPPPPAAAPVPQPAAAVAASLVDGSPVNPPNSGRSNLSPHEQAFGSALDRASLVDPVLGFRRNQPGA